MQTAEYTQLRAYEDWYWWYAAQRMNLFETLKKLNLPRKARVLDAGCGTGATLELLTRELEWRGHGVDVSDHAAALWNGHRGVMRCRASVNALPYGEQTFDAVYSVDVLGCRGVDREMAAAEMARVLRPDGLLVLLTPAYQWMLSAHDVAVHSIHRFTRSELAELARRAGFEVMRLTHRFPLFFPIIAAMRMMRKVEIQNSSARSDLRPMPKWLNGFLLGLAKAEHALVRGIGVPFGSTILLVARKVGR